MKDRRITAALAGLILLTGCSSAEQKPDLDSSLINSMVSNASTTPAPDPPPNEETGEPDVNPLQTADQSEPETAEAPDTSVPAIQTITTPNADNNFEIFFSEVSEQFALTDEEKSFVEYSLFVGDSICSGFGVYGIVPWDYVAAKGNLGSRSFFDYSFSFRDKEEQSYAKVLKTAKPRYVFLSMGMNDVNMVYEDAYCENYRGIIQATLDGSGADVFVAAITPICSDFCDNSIIDSFNDTIEAYIKEEFPERVHFFDFGRYLKNDRNMLRACLHSGDGIHLAPYCYDIALWEMRRALTEAGLWKGTAPTDGSKPYRPAEAVQTEEPDKPESSESSGESEASSADEPQSTPAETTGQTTVKTAENKPSETAASPDEITDEPEIFEIPVD